MLTEEFKSVNKTLDYTKNMILFRYYSLKECTIRQKNPCAMPKRKVLEEKT